MPQADGLLGSGHTRSLWMEAVPARERPALERDITADVCVVGAGIAGISTAYLLSREGRSVVVLDDGPIGGGETSRTTAHLTNVIDDRYRSLAWLHGEEGACIAAESHTRAIDRIEDNVRDEGIACDFERVDGYLFLPRGKAQRELDQELESASRAGLTGIERVERAPFESYDTGPCLRFPRQAQFHPLLYLDGLATAILSRGGEIFTRTHAQSFEGETRVRVSTASGGSVSAGAVVIATNSPITDRVAIHTKQAPYRTYVIAAHVPSGSVVPALYWDTPWPYHYVRLARPRPGKGEPEFLVVGGEDHRTGQEDDADERYARLESWMRERFPSAGPVRYRWSGQVLEPVDGVAYIGRDPGDDPNLYVATGDSGMGMTHGTIAGMLLTDLIVGRENPWTRLYDPKRKSLRAAGEFLKENLNVAAQYVDRVTGGEVDSTDAIARGTGAVVRRGLKKIAVYRDPQGELHERSAVCVHLGCIVDWNSNESTWDCPCHGSRFDPYGKVLNGPANRDLEPAG